jgi:hypothetical protein
VTDGGAAEKGLARLTAALPGGAAPGYVVTGDYALLAATQQLAIAIGLISISNILSGDTPNGSASSSRRSFFIFKTSPPTTALQTCLLERFFVDM